MIIGIPKEIMPGEQRVSATPETVAKLVQDGYFVMVERGAGEGAFFSDASYEAAGAQMIADAKSLYARSDAILKVKEPQFNESEKLHEAEMMHSGQLLIAFIHPASPSNHEMVRLLAEKGVTSLTLDSVPRISRAQSMDALTSMSTCAGYKGMLMAAESLGKFMPQIFCAVGQVRPANALIVGAGVAGLQAIATAKRLGAIPYAADIRPDAAEQAKSLGAKLIDLGVPAEEAIGSGGYAKELSASWLDREREALRGIIPQMDIVFLSALVPGRRAPVLMDEAMVASMKPGSVIVDISIDQGGNCAATAPGEIIKKHGVIINGIKNIPGLLPVSSTWMFANNVYNLVHYLTRENQIALDRSDEIVSSILTTADFEIVHAGARDAMGL